MILASHYHAQITIWIGNRQIEQIASSLVHAQWEQSTWVDKSPQAQSIWVHTLKTIP